MTTRSSSKTRAKAAAEAAEAEAAADAADPPEIYVLYGASGECLGVTEDLDRAEVAASQTGGALVHGRGQPPPTLAEALDAGWSEHMKAPAPSDS